MSPAEAAGEPKPMRGAAQRWAQRNTRTATAPIARQPRFDNAPLANQGARRPHVAAAQRAHLVVERRHDEEGVKPASDDDDRAERPAHVLGVKIGDEAGDRRHEREGDEKRDAAAVARAPFAEQRRILKLETSWLLNPVDIERGAGEGGREGQRKRSPDHDGSLLLSGPSSMKRRGKREALDKAQARDHACEAGDGVRL